MQTKRTIALTSFVDEAYNVFGKVYKQQAIEIQKLEEYKLKFTDATFHEFYKEFEEELELNIVEYANINTINDYVRLYLKKFYDWQPFFEDDNRRIMENGHEVGFLIKLKTNIEETDSLLAEFFQSNNDGEPSFILIDFYNKIANKNMDDSGTQIKSQIQPDIRFDFQQIKLECEGCSTIIEKIKFINERLFDFKQWQLQYDEIEEDFINGNRYIYTALYYPKLFALCKIELERLNKLLSIEKEDPTHKALANNPIVMPNDHYNYKWNATDTDLLELLTALYKKEAFLRRDGKAITRTELTNYFQELLGLEIKDVEGKLTRATKRNDNTPFLDGLAVAFKSYTAEKEANKKQRKY